MVRKALLKMCREVRKHAVLLTDALAIPDFVLKAPFGCYDGDVYRKYFDVRVFVVMLLLFLSLIHYPHEGCAERATNQREWTSILLRRKYCTTH